MQKLAAILRSQTRLFSPMKCNTKLCYRRRTARRDTSVNVLATVETSCAKNPEQIELVELECYSSPTCRKQPRLVDCRIGVVNKLDRRRRQRRRRRVTDNAIDSPRRNFLVRSLERSSRGKYLNFWRYPNSLITQCGIGEKKPSCQIRSFRYNTGLWRTDRRTRTCLAVMKPFEMFTAISGWVNEITIKKYWRKHWPKW